MSAYNATYCHSFYIDLKETLHNLRDILSQQRQLPNNCLPSAGLTPTNSPHQSKEYRMVKKKC